jgi:hypothetical protein
MPTLKLLLGKLNGYYVHKIDDELIDHSIEQDPSDIENFSGSLLKSQPACRTIECFYADKEDLIYYFNDEMPVSFCNVNGVVLATDIYGKERQLKIVTNLHLSNQVFENLVY